MNPPVRDSAVSSVIKAAMLQAEGEALMKLAYQAGAECVRLKLLNQPFRVLVDTWTNVTVHDQLRRAFWLGVEDA